MPSALAFWGLVVYVGIKVSGLGCSEFGASSLRLPNLGIWEWGFGSGVEVKAWELPRGLGLRVRVQGSWFVYLGWGTQTKLCQTLSHITYTIFATV